MLPSEKILAPYRKILKDPPVDAELHSDEEAALSANGSKQANIWGVNLYPEISGDYDDFEFVDLMLELRP